MRKTIKIECSPEVMELNEAIEVADLVTGFTWDNRSGEVLANMLELEGCTHLACDLKNKLSAVYGEKVEG